MDSMVSMITNSIPDSFYVLAMSLYGNFQDTTIWKDRHYSAFELLGADSIRKIPSDYPYILFAQKGNPDFAKEALAVTGNELLSISEVVSGKIATGSMTSTSIGPVKTWRDFHWNVARTSQYDSFKVILQGIDSNGIKNPIISLNESQKHLTSIDAQFPDLRNYKNIAIEAELKDTVDNDPPSFEYWFILHDEVPELAVSPVNGFYFSQDTVKAGQPVYLNYAIKNVSQTDMEAFKVRYSLLTGDGKSTPLPSKELPLLVKKGVWLDSNQINTKSLSGLYTLLVQINPKDSNWVYEKEQFNNLFYKTFYVIPDIVNPLLDVTFDGIHILDGDIVSARPNIQITLNDDNEFLPLEDTSSFELYLTHPSGTIKRVYFQQSTGDYQLSFSPPAGKKNKAIIDYSPILKDDGKYSLRVKATDVSGNQSGSNDYSIGFEVINRSTITQVMNYPNPFTTSTRFVFTLTGYIIPDYFRIQILNVSGRVIREVGRNELGHIHIGRNITEYAWDGTDTYGDRVANGVYFYRVITKIAGEEIERRDSGADAYFHKGFGKMVLFR